MIVIDASVAIKIVSPIREEGADIANSLLELHLDYKQPILVPELIYIEVANALTTKTTSTKRGIKEGLKTLFGLNFLLYELTENDLIKTAMLAKKYETSVYDMLYAVIAKNKKIDLITADANFAKKTHFPYVKTLSEITGATHPTPK